MNDNRVVYRKPVIGRAMPLIQSASILAGLAVVSLTACTTNRPALPTESIAKIAITSSVTVVRYDPPRFLIRRGRQNHSQSAPGLFGLVWPLLESPEPQRYAEAAGAQFISSSHLQDPIASIEARFLTAWQRDFTFSAMPTSRDMNSDSVQQLRELFKTEYVLDFKTEDWGIDPIASIGLGTPPERYRVTYRARARLVRLSDEEIVWKGWCAYREKDALTPQLTSAEITGDDQALSVKSAMETLADACADRLWKQFIGHKARPDLPQ